MSPYLLVLAFAAGLFGSWLSLLVKQGHPWWLALIAGVASYSVWALALRVSTWNVVFLSAVFDVLVAVSWFVGFWLIGKQPISLVQWAGIALLCAGLALINR